MLSATGVTVIVFPVVELKLTFDAPDVILQFTEDVVPLTVAVILPVWDVPSIIFKSILVLFKFKFVSTCWDDVSPIYSITIAGRNP